MSSIRPGNHDRAWNDPPVFGYSPCPPRSDAGAPNGPAKRTPLNKRVPFPMGGTPCSGPAPKGGLPPCSPPPNLLAVHPSPFHHLSPAADTNNISTELLAQDSEELIEQMSSTLEETLKEITETESKCADISKRLKNLASDWREGKLNSDIQQRLLKLCGYLKEKDFTNANLVQVALAVDYTAECASWITAVRHIITKSLENKV